MTKPKKDDTKPPIGDTTSAQNTIQDTTPVVTETEKQLAEAKKHIEALTETSKRALADLANYKRRSEEEKQAFIQYSNALLIAEILEIVDNFERAFTHIPEGKQEWAEGIINIEKKLKNILEKHGLKEMEVLGKEINPHFHEALMTGPGEKNKIIEVFEKGYLLGEKVLRAAKVKVGNDEKSS